MQPTGEDVSSGRRRARLGSKIFGLIALSAAGVLAFVNLKLGDDVRSPVPLDSAQVSQASGLDALPSSNVQINATKVIDSGVRRTKARSSGGPGVGLKYLLVQVNDRYFIAEVREEVSTGTLVSGRLTKWTSNPHQEVIAEVGNKFPDKRSQFLPFQLDGNLEQELMSFYLWIFAGVLALVGLVAVSGLMEDKVVPDK